MKDTRRDFLKKGGGCALGMVVLATQMHHLGTMSALAQRVIDSQPEDLSGYKALVLLFWAGGNDGNNMVIPVHADATISNYAAYSAARSTQSLAISQAALANTQIPVPRLNGLMYALHPNMGPQTQNGTTIVNNGIHELWNQQKLAVVTNVGNLAEPLTKARYQSSLYKKPYQLFSHSDQVTQQQTSISTTQAFTGWGGRISDKLTQAANPNGLVPMVTSIAGAQLFTAGQVTLPMAITQANFSGTSNLTTALTPAGFGTPPTGSNLARFNAFNSLLTLDRSSGFIDAASHVTELAMQANNALQTSQDVSTLFPNTSVGLQLKQVARLIKSRTNLGVNRQVFYVQLGGFDTHTAQITTQANNFTQISQAMRAFWDELVLQGIQNSVTTFTLSDFCRTFNPAGSGANVGSDHAWGNHMLVMGGDVVGGNFYGSLRMDGTGNYFPTLTLGGPDDTDTGGAPRGRWIPTTSVDQYASVLARWFGLSDADQGVVFPNLSKFAAISSQLGFLP